MPDLKILNKARYYKIIFVSLNLWLLYLELDNMIWFANGLKLKLILKNLEKKIGSKIFLRE
jgi:hypothetical protein